RASRPILRKRNCLTPTSPTPGWSRPVLGKPTSKARTFMPSKTTMPVGAVPTRKTFARRTKTVWPQKPGRFRINPLRRCAMLKTLEQITFLGPATVMRKDHQLLHLDLGDHCRWAELALAFPYHPNTGDVVLAIGQEEKCYVIGVLRGTGRTN